MKKLAFVFLIFSSSMLAEEPGESLSYAESIPPPFYPFAISGSYVDVNKAHFRTEGFEENTIHYRQWETAFAYTHPFSSCWGLLFGAGWVGSEVNMQNNPEFSETIFNYVNFTLGAYTKACTDWTWTLSISAFFDQAVLSLIDYTLYQGVLFGKYSACSWLELDFGVIVEAGLNKTKVWPILGFVWTPYECFTFSAVYPVNISIEYDLSECVSFAGSIRFLRNRHRLETDEFDSQGIFEYKNTGAELDLIVHPFPWLSLKGFIGYTFGGDLKIADRNDGNATHFKFDGSGYAGASAILSF